MFFLLVLLLLFFFSLYFKLNQNEEKFENLNIYPTKLYGLHKFVKLNEFGRAEKLYIKPITPSPGESRCDVVICPSWIPDNISCYKCI